MIGFSYLKEWQPGLTPLFTFLLGLFYFFCLTGFGRTVMSISKIKIFQPWELSCRFIIGIFSFSLTNQILAILQINNYFCYLMLLSFYSLFGILEFRNIKFIRLNLKRIDLIPAVLLAIVFLIRSIYTILPSSKIDELSYHMLLPSRIVSEQALNYYHLPWPSAIWPHMHYQLISPPFYSIGLPDSVNFISFSIFLSLVYTASYLVFKSSKDIGLSLWSAVLIVSGLHSIVDCTTSASNSLLALSGCITLLILAKPSEYLPSKNLKSFSIFFSLLFIGIIGSKISMLPIGLLLIVLFLKVVRDYWTLEKVKIATLYFFIPIIIFYLPLLIYTWIESGSPFGPILASLFTGRDFLIDPLNTSLKGDYIIRENITHILFLMFTKWSPLIWISWLILPHKIIKTQSKLTLSFVFLSQFFLIWMLLPNKPRHFGGFQYCALIILLAELAPYFYTRFKKYSIMIFLTFSVPWLALDLYYSLPLISKSFFKSETFKRDYIPFYSDFLEVDKLIEEDSQILFIEPRINGFHSPRPIFMSEIDIHNKEKPTYLLSFGTVDNKKLTQFKLGLPIYQNPNAKKFCYRVPGKKCAETEIVLYKLNPMN